jgi:hypothetical protein
MLGVKTFAYMKVWTMKLDLTSLIDYMQLDGMNFIKCLGFCEK